MMILSVVYPIVIHAQIDDLLDGPWAQPALDVLERRREEPLCLRCSDAYDLTEIPGISQRTARSIVRAVDAGAVTSISALCDTLCLSPDQFILLTSCTTLECTCGGAIRSASARLRLPSSSSGAGLARIDADHALGRAGLLYSHRLDEPSSAIGVWATARVGELHVGIGDMALRLGTGLIMGTSVGLSRAPADLVRSSETSWALRPWTATSREGAMRGLFVRTSLPSTMFDILVGVGQTQRGSTAETVYTGALTGIIQGTSYSVAIVSTPVSLLSSISSTRSSERGSMSAELAVNTMFAWSGHLRGEIHTSAVDVGISLWRYDPDLIPHLGTSSGTASTPTNHSGFLIYGRAHPWVGSTLMSSLSYSGRITRYHLAPLPTAVFDLTTDLVAQPFRGVDVSTRLRYERSVESINETNVRRMDVSTLMMGRIDINIPIARTVQGRVRCDLRTISWRNAPDTDHGSLLFFDVRWRMQPEITIRARWTQFSSTSGTIAPRMLDATVTGALQSVVANGKGTRWTITARWQIRPWLAASCAVHENRSVVDGTVRRDLSALFQIDLRLRPTGRREFIAIDDESGTRLE